MTRNPESRYARPPEDELNVCLMEFDIVFTNYCNTIGYLKDVYYDSNDVIDAIVRIDQREYYHYIFHNMPKGMSEIKKAAVFCYWLLKYRPFSVEFAEKTETERDDENARRLYDDAQAFFTERFCLHFLDSLSKRYLGRGIDISDSNAQELEYVLRHADMSKEVLTVIFEILVDTSVIHA